MSVIDIRQEQSHPVTAIRCQDNLGGTGHFTTLVKVTTGRQRVHLCGHLSRPGIFRGDENNVHIEGEDEARNLIKALEKAIELKWFR